MTRSLLPARLRAALRPIAHGLGALALLASLGLPRLAGAATVDPYVLTLSGTFTSYGGSTYFSSYGDAFTVTFCTDVDALATVTTSPDSWDPIYGLGHITTYVYTGTMTFTTDNYSESFAGRLIWTDSWRGTTSFGLSDASYYLPADPDGTGWGLSAYNRFSVATSVTARGFTDFSLPTADVLTDNFAGPPGVSISRYFSGGSWGGSSYTHSLFGRATGITASGLPEAADNALPAVPLPAGGLLLLSGLAGIGLMRRRRAA